LIERDARQSTHLKNHLIKVMFNGFKVSSFRCKSHVHEIILQKNMFGSPLKLILGFYRIFYTFDI
jgi:hypothetical protein